MEILLFQASFALSALAFVFSLLYLFRREDFFKNSWYRVLLASVVLHALSFVLRTADFWAGYPEGRYYLPLHSFFSVLSYLALVINAVCLALASRYQISVLGCFVLPLSLAAQGVCAWFLNASMPLLAPALHSYWMNIHPLILMGAYGVFVNAFGVSLAFLIQERQLKSRHPKGFVWQLPALEVLDRVNGKMVLLALPALALGMALGGLWSWDSWGRIMKLDIKETGAMASLIIYGAYLGLRWAGGWQGRRAVWINLAGFASVLITFLGVNIRLHHYVVSLMR